MMSELDIQQKPSWKWSDPIHSGSKPSVLKHVHHDDIVTVFAAFTALMFIIITVESITSIKGFNGIVVLGIVSCYNVEIVVFSDLDSVEPDACCKR